QLSGTTTCEPTSTVPEFDDVAQLSASATFRKAALHLAYRMPTSEEVARLASEGESALPELIEGLFEEDAFYERLKDMFNDKLLTERYLAYTGYALNILNEEMYPESGEPWDALTDEDQRRAINHALADEPLDF